MTGIETFSELVASRGAALSRTEHRVARYFAGNRHQVLVQSAADLAQAIGTSDATVIRTARALGFDGLEGLRRAIAEEFNAGPTPQERLSRTIRDNAGNLDQALERTLAAQADAIAQLRATLSAEQYKATVQTLAQAREIAVFGIGPTASMAQYFCVQLRRFGLAARPLSGTGLLLADDLLPLQAGDVVFVMAYGRVYGELAVVLDHAQGLGLQTILVTDSLEQELAGRVGRIVTVPRGRRKVSAFIVRRWHFSKRSLSGSLL